MSGRFMRIMVMFDLPSVKEADMKEYRRFRSFLVKNGFIMMQESIYTKLVVNSNSTKLVCAALNKNLPSKGLVQVLEVTEKQFASIKYLCGKKQTKVVDSMERIVYL